jgi:hypothetical protein
MNKKIPTKFINYLFRYMLVFEIDKFILLGVTNKTIKARVGWPDEGLPDYDENEEAQDIEWDIQHFDNIEDALFLVEVIRDNQAIKGDKIIMPLEEIRNKTGWGTSKFESALKTLLEMKVDMVDEGRRTDFFFVHL